MYQPLFLLLDKLRKDKLPEGTMNYLLICVFIIPIITGDHSWLFVVLLFTSFPLFQCCQVQYSGALILHSTSSYLLWTSPSLSSQHQLLSLLSLLRSHPHPWPLQTKPPPWSLPTNQLPWISTTQTLPPTLQTSSLQLPLLRIFLQWQLQICLLQELQQLPLRLPPPLPQQLLQQLQQQQRLMENEYL